MDFGQVFYSLESEATLKTFNVSPLLPGGPGGIPREEKRDAALTASYAVLAAAYLPIPLM